MCIEMRNRKSISVCDLRACRDSEFCDLPRIPEPRPQAPHSIRPYPGLLVQEPHQTDGNEKYQDPMPSLPLVFGADTPQKLVLQGHGAPRVGSDVGFQGPFAEVLAAECESVGSEEFTLVFALILDAKNQTHARSRPVYERRGPMNKGAGAIMDYDD
ncbi:hypothetical protein TruAng_010247 [Truncatella angustata]|nr:hypothetical protein TruAng_010247 [Truncatella angustata]